MYTIFWLENLKRPLTRTRHRWEDNIRMALTEIGWEGVDRIHVAHKRVQQWDLLNTVINLQVLYKMGNLLTS